MCVYIYICMYIYFEREREREREKLIDIQLVIDKTKVIRTLTSLITHASHVR